VNAGVRERAAALRGERLPFVHARVVLAERPTSAKPGDEAIVLPDGTIEGFVGGTCAESTVRAQALALLDSGESRLLRISPVEEPAVPGKHTVVNPCLSGGTLEIFLEPVVPAPRVVVHGHTPIADALAALGGALGYDVERWNDAVAVDDASAVVVASHGRDEEALLTAALRAGVPYVGLVASHKRGDAVVAALDVDEDLRARVHTPAGLDLGARIAEEVALSILAEIVALRPRPSGRPLPSDDAGAGAIDVPRANDPTTAGRSPAERELGAGGGAAPAAGPAIAIDPVCGMEVAAVETSLHLDHEGTRRWFCGSGCLRAFASDPSAYLERA
jgi:xanthine dehydrogenase accessory factor